MPLQVTGPPANRFDLVIVGDGYTADEQDKFMAQVDKQLNVMWSIEPYKTYRNYINVYAVKVISGDSRRQLRPGPDVAAQDHAARAAPSGAAAARPACSGW